MPIIGGPMSDRWIAADSAGDAQDLVSRIANDGSLKPWVIISTPDRNSPPRFDMEQLVDDVEGVANIAVVRHGDATWKLSELLNEKEDVFAGAARVYPAGYTPENSLTPGPVRLVHANQNPQRSTAQLVSDALGLAYNSGVFEKLGNHSRKASATISGFVGSQRAIVEVDGEAGFATVAGELTYPGVPLEWLFRQDQKISGTFDPESRRFLVDTESPAAADFLHQFPWDSVTLGLVAEVERQKAKIQIHPGHTFVLSREELSPNPKDRVDLLLAPGEVVPVRLYRDAQGLTRIRMDDIDDQEDLLDSLSFGAGPWLRAGRDLVQPEPELVTLEELSITNQPLELLVESQVETESTQKPRPRPGPGLAVAIAADVLTVEEPNVSTKSSRSAFSTLENQVHVLKAENAELKRRLQSLGGSKAEELYREVRHELNFFISESSRLQDEIRAAKADLAEFRKRARDDRAIASAESPRSRQIYFSSNEEWFAEEVRRAWIDTYTAQERQRWVVNSSGWSLGERFISSLDGMKDSQLRRLFRLVTHIVSGRSQSEDVVEVHPLRTGDKPSDPAVSRSDSAICMRAYVEQGVPQSRRLHYWKRVDNSVELSRVVLHDDMNP
jgi:hypothetical protein